MSTLNELASQTTQIKNDLINCHTKLKENLINKEVEIVGNEKIGILVNKVNDIKTSKLPTCISQKHDFWIYNTLKLPNARSDIRLVFYKGKIYCISGNNDNNTAVKDNLCYDTKNNSFSELSRIPRDYDITKIHYAVNVDGIIYTVIRYGPNVYFVKYDIEKDTWTSFPDKITFPIENFASYSGIEVVDKNIYLIGGEDWNTDNVVKRNLIYNTLTNSFSTRTNALYAVQGMGCVRVNDYIYLLGGNYPRQYADYNQVYNILTDTWSEKPRMPIKKTNIKACLIDNKIYCIDNNGDTPRPTKTMCYDIATETWSIKTPYENIHSTSFFSVINDEKYIYAFGGSVSASDVLDTIKIYII